MWRRVAGLVGGLIVGDWATTIAALEMGGEERMWLSRTVIDMYGYLGFTFFKVLSVLMVLFIGWVASRDLKGLEIIARAILIILLGEYSFMLGNNIGAIMILLGSG